MIWVLLILGHNIVFYEGRDNGELAHARCIMARDILDATENTTSFCYPMPPIK